MHKAKDGKVYASLTEVKNKTGDIFAIVDEFGEISLTSYNKIRYKIVKVDINSVIDLEEKPGSKTPQAARNKDADEKIEKKERTVKLDTAPVTHHSPIQNIQSNPVQHALMNATIDIDPWMRDSKDEKEFTKVSLQPLISA